jgi:hypothetical protein
VVEDQGGEIISKAITGLGVVNIALGLWMFIGLWIVPIFNYHKQVSDLVAFEFVLMAFIPVAIALIAGGLTLVYLSRRGST